jgi:DNA-binding NtrC family response regulator
VNPAPAVAVAEAARKTIRILVVDDEHTLRDSCVSVLGMDGYTVACCGSGGEALRLLQATPFDILLVDLHMSPVTGLDVVDFCASHAPDTLAIVMTGNPSVETSMDALRRGAWDYLPKPFAASHLRILIGRAAHTVIVSRESRELAAARDARDGHSDHLVLLGRSAPFERVIELARRVSATDASVFLTGESGTGKEQIAQFIHQHGRRASRPLVAVNCAALPEGLLESEMFGHVQGAFTGAVRDKPGLLEVASGGTLFLDEITEMAVALQAKLLRVIQDGVVRRVGSTATDSVVNVRFIAAANQDTAEAVLQGRLRSDLFYRLCVVPIHVPPLRDRREDIPLLAQHFLERFWKQHRDGRTPVPAFSEEAMEDLQRRHWPGNVRELQNVVEHAVVLLEPGQAIRPEDLPAVRGVEGHSDSGLRNRFTEADFGDGSYHGARERVLAHFERTYLTQLVERTRGNMSRAARLAGVDRTTLYRLMDKHNLQRDTVITSR